MSVPSIDYGLTGGPTIVALTTLRSRVRERVDMVGSSFISDTNVSLDAWINEANQKLHGMLVEAFGDEYASSESTFTTVSGTTDFALPSGFYKLYGVEIYDNGEWVTILPYNRNERNKLKNSNGNVKPRYRIVGNYLRLLPEPTAGLSGKILYAPGPATLASGTDTVEYPNGWDRYIVVDAAIQALAKEESSVTTLVAERELIEKRIRLEKENRDYDRPMRVTLEDEGDDDFYRRGGHSW